MGRKAKDLTGRRYGRLTVIERRGSDKRGNALWLCRCDCGNEIIVRGDSLRSENTMSCGCYNRDKASERMREMWKDEEFKQMKSDEIREMWNDKEFRQMQSDKMKEQWKDEEFKQMQSDKMKEMVKEQWKDEEFKQMMSEKSSKRMREMVKKLWQDEDMKWRMGYKGGITPISDYLRNLPIVVKWMEDTKENVNYTCELIGKQCYVETHHIKPFCELVMEAHVLNGIQIKEIVADYTEEELKLLVAYITKWHQDFSNAIVLSKEVHYYFHNVFMKGKGRESSVEDVEEFKERYLNGEFKDLLGDD